jgi:hypothetical protein
MKASILDQETFVFLRGFYPAGLAKTIKFSVQLYPCEGLQAENRSNYLNLLARKAVLQPKILRKVLDLSLSYNIASCRSATDQPLASQTNMV